jgi:hypothetical protein
LQCLLAGLWFICQFGWIGGAFFHPVFLGFLFGRVIVAIFPFLIFVMTKSLKPNRFASSNVSPFIKI